jgi:uroporphyrin-III C-methyltransferase / precorrin-2 dehydrogenase / sirohydrochlorin ferrochelatase
MLAAARERLRARAADPITRRRIVQAALAGPLDPLDPGAATRVGAALAGPLPAPAPAIVTLASDDPDDLTLRQARALALAERVLFAPDISTAILARARADAPRLARAARPAQMEPGDVWVERE